MNYFWNGFEKTAKIYDNIMKAIGSKPVANRLTSGAAFAAKNNLVQRTPATGALKMISGEAHKLKIENLRAANAAAKAAKTTVSASPVKNFSKSVQQSAANKITNAPTKPALSPLAQKSSKFLNNGSQLRSEMIGDKAI